MKAKDLAAAIEDVLKPEYCKEGEVNGLKIGDPERDVTIVPIGSPGERWASLNAGHVHASLFQPPFTLRARKAGFATLLDFSTLDFPYILSGVLTTRSFIRSDRDTVMNFMRGLADGMDFYRDEKN